MKCWICRADAQTAEHAIKRSDLVQAFGSSQTLWLHSKHQSNQIIQGVGSKRVKFALFICSACNNQRTQPHDRAWEKLSYCLSTRNPPLRPGMRVKLTRSIPGGVSVGEAALNVHLYFVKLFGCLIVEHNLPIPISGFSAAILKNCPHPRVWLSFWVGLGLEGVKKQAGRSDLWMVTHRDTGLIKNASWFYTVGTLSVKVAYQDCSEFPTQSSAEWHPTQSNEVLRING